MNLHLDVPLVLILLKIFDNINMHWGWVITLSFLYMVGKKVTIVYPKDTE